MVNPEASPPGDEASVEWCLGLPLVEHRTLSSEELQQLQAESGKLRNRGCLFGCLSPISFFFLMALSAGLNEAFGQTSLVQALASIIMILALVIVGTILLRANDALKRSKGIKGDIKIGYTKKFAGALSREYFEAYRFPELLKQTTAQAAVKNAERSETESDVLGVTPATTPAEKQVSIEVLPNSHRLWKIKGESLQRWVDVGWSSVAEAPQFASMAAHWVEPIDTSQPGTLIYNPQSPHYGQRDLSTSEKTEIQKKIRRIWFGPFWSALFLSLWIGISLIGTLATRAPIRMEPGAYFLIACTLLCYYHLWRAVAMAQRLKRDLDNGVVVIVRLASNEPPVALQNEQATPQPDKTPIVTVEILPVSGLQWTESGKPSEWRKIAVP